MSPCPGSGQFLFVFDLPPCCKGNRSLSAALGAVIFCVAFSFRPRRAYTVQIRPGKAISNLSQNLVRHQFRQTDLAKGAPRAPGVIITDTLQLRDSSLHTNRNTAKVRLPTCSRAPRPGPLDPLRCGHHTMVVMQTLTPINIVLLCAAKS